MTLDTPPEIQQAIDKEWSFLAAPGTWFTGEERVAIAAAARTAMAGEAVDDDVVAMVAASSPLISAAWVDALEIELPAYAEIIGIVARLSAVDRFHQALGMPLLPLPDAQPGEPTRTPPPADLVHGKSFVPMVAPVSIPNTISLVPAETAAWLDLSDAMYMTLDEMGDPDFRRALHRTQIELVASRTSQINECFY